MAKFTVFFKEKPIQSKLIDSGVVHIGRDDSNDIIVDSLAIAPAHAVVIINEKECVIKQLNDDFPLIINDEKLKTCTLNNQDKITIGKHSIIFYTSEPIVNDLPPTQSNPKLDSLNADAEHALPDASLQIMSGKYIGRILPLKKGMTKLGRKGNGVIVIAKRKEGYFISALENHSSLIINNAPLSDNTIKLQNNDILTVDNTSLQFFQD